MSKMMTLTRAKKEFFSGLEHAPYSSALILANLYFFLKKKETTTQNKEKIIDCINAIRYELSDKDFLRVWDSVAHISDRKHPLKEQATCKAICTFKHQLIHDINWLIKLPEDRLITLGQNSAYTREVIIGLIRKHLINLKEDDVFKNYDYIDIMKADLQQSSLEVNVLIKQCASLPIASLKALGTTSKETAQIIMQCLSVHIQGFEVIAYYAKKHIELRGVILENWKMTIESLGYNEEITLAIKSNAKQLSAQYSEFKVIETVERINRAAEMPTIKEGRSYRKICALGCLGVATALGNESMSKNPYMRAKSLYLYTLARSGYTAIGTAAPWIVAGAFGAIAVGCVGYSAYQYYKKNDNVVKKKNYKNK